MANVPTGLQEFIVRENVQLPASPIVPIALEKQSQIASQGGPQSQKFDDRGALVVSEGTINIAITTFLTTTSSLLALPYNNSRKYLLLQNNGADFFFLNFGNNATLQNGLKMASNAVYEMLRPSIQDIYIIGNSAGISVTIMEGT